MIELTERNVSIVTARDAEKTKGPTGITDTFSLEGRVVAWATFRWESGDASGPRQIEARWYNGEKLVTTRSNNVSLMSSPWHVWFSHTTIGLGVGKCRVELYSAGKLLGTKHFVIVERL